MNNPSNAGFDRPLYAVGDIHGRADLLERLLKFIAADATELGAQPLLVFLGDYVDRGPASRAVIQRLVDLDQDCAADIVALRGNHDQYFLEFMRSPETGREWRRYGGHTTLASYGVTAPPTDAPASTWEEAAAALKAATPQSHVDFLKRTRLHWRAGRYVFVHAGVRPGAALDAQDPRDLLSIRHTFLNIATPLPGSVVVFGHTPFDAPRVEEGKIGLDTGAYASGVLTALRIWKGEESLLDTRSPRARPAR